MVDSGSVKTLPLAQRVLEGKDVAEASAVVAAAQLERHFFLFENLHESASPGILSSADALNR